MAKDIKDLTNDSGELISGWDWENKHVNESYSVNNVVTNTNIHDIVESGTVLIAAGPADISASSTSESFRIVPIGLIENASIAMSKPLSRIFEIGSKLSYIIPGRTVGQIALARVLFDGPSLLKVMYQGEVAYDEYLGGNDVKSVAFNSCGKVDESGARIAKEVQNIGSGQIAMNLASSFFEQPVGLVFYFKDQESDQVGQMYFEGCRIGSYNMGISANMNVLTESISMEFTQCTPVTNGEDWRVPSGGDEGNASSMPDIPIIGMPQ